MRLIILGVLIVVAGIVSVTMSGQSQKALSKQTKTHRERQLPIVDFSEKLSSVGETSTQHSKASRYDRQSGQRIEEAYLISGRTWSSHWARDLSALPFPQSDVVLIGSVMDAKAHLSNDKTGIYSEFKVEAEEVVKKSDNDPLNRGSMVALERFGGAVRFSSGVIQRYETTGQGMPCVGERYVFFLKQLEKSDFSIITGYQLDGELVIPLDGSAVEEGNQTYPFDKYQGYDVTTFLRIVRNEAADNLTKTIQ